MASGTSPLVTTSLDLRSSAPACVVRTPVATRHACGGSLNSAPNLVGTICSSDKLWLESLAPVMTPSPVSTGGNAIVYFNIGANKGFNIVTFLRRYANHSLTGHAWMSEMDNFARRTRTRYSRVQSKQYRSCGRCGGCFDDLPGVGLAASEVDVHAFELLPANVAWLRWALAAFGVRASLSHKAVSNVTAPAFTPRAAAGGLGYEKASYRPMWGWGYVRSHSLALDDYFAEEEIKFAHVLSIDAEGADTQILRGLSDTLAANRVGVVEFEGKGRDADAENVEWLRHMNYSCFVETASGCILPASCGTSSVLCRTAKGESDTCGNFVCGQGAFLEQLWLLSNACATCSPEELQARV